MRLRAYLVPFISSIPDNLDSLSDLYMFFLSFSFQNTMTIVINQRVRNVTIGEYI